MKSKQVAIKKNYFSPVVWDQMGKMASTFIQSRAMPSTIQNAAQAIVVMQTGFEMGMKPMEAIKSLYIVNGQVNIYGAATIRRLREHGYSVSYEMKKEDGGSCTATVTKGKEKYVETYSFDNAAKSDYTTANGKLKVGWKPGINRIMKLRYGVISMIIKSYIPEVMGSAGDIVEVAEDYPEIKEEKKAETGTVEPKTVVSTPAEKEENLQSFLANNKKETKIVEPEKKEVKGGKDGQ